MKVAFIIDVADEVDCEQVAHAIDELNLAYERVQSFGVDLDAKGDSVKPEKRRVPRQRPPAGEELLVQVLSHSWSASSNDRQVYGMGGRSMGMVRGTPPLLELELRVCTTEHDTLGRLLSSIGGTGQLIMRAVT